MPVDIVGLDYDYWYEMAKVDGLLDPGEEPKSLSSTGYLYYVRSRRAGQLLEPTWVDSCGADSIETVMKEAEVKVPTAIDWTDSA